MCEFTSFVELYALEDKTAEHIADCLVDFCLRWDTPSCIWSGHDSEIKNEVVKSEEGLCLLGDTADVDEPNVQ
jgi:hypothetical protein